MKTLIIALGGAMALAAAMPANAAVYTFDTSVGTGSASGSITTDDTIGALTADNITAFAILINDGSNSFSFTNADGAVVIVGNALTATDMGLFFDFSAQGENYALFQNPYAGSGGNYLCVQTIDCYYPTNEDDSIPGMGLRLEGDILHSQLTGNQQFAQAAAVPEPASWALMMLGFGIVGYAMRRQGKVTTNVRFA